MKSFLQFAENHHQFIFYLKIATSDKIGFDKAIEEERLANLSQPHLWYHKARQMKRKIILHVGPTNSGKTHNALESLKEAGTGVYCGPLRLLAQEIYEKFDEENINVSLLTGQQRKIHPESTHVACTVEMASVNEVIDCAVIDEIQMINDKDRGWAWTRALLGIPAKTIHLCGNDSANYIVQEIVNECGDEIEIRTYTRLSQLHVAKTPMSTIYDLLPGDCVIGFSRRNIYDMRCQIERETGYKCCVIYGRLPPETRSQQAALFNSSKNGHEILVASDAIGMGLNLNIRRVIFSSLQKYDGNTRRQLFYSEIKQIGGRAGRYKSKFPIGEVTSFSEEENDLIRVAMNSTLMQSKFAYLRPEFELIELFTLSCSGRLPFSVVLWNFSQTAELDNNYLLGGFADVIVAAQLIDDVNIALRDRFVFCCAPFDATSELSAQYFLRYAREYAYAVNSSSNLLPSNTEYHVKVGIPKNHIKPPRENHGEDAIKHDLQVLEEIHQILDLYIWLAWRFPREFVDAEYAMQLQSKCESAIELCLELAATPSKPFKMRKAKGKKKHKHRR